MKPVRMIMYIFILFIIPNCIDKISNELEEISKSWKLDNIGCNGQRNEIIKQQYNILKENFEGKNLDFVIKNLGKPNEIWKKDGSEQYVYWVSKGIQCQDSTEKITDALRLIVVINKNKVIKISKFIS